MIQAKPFQQKYLLPFQLILNNYFYIPSIAKAESNNDISIEKEIETKPGWNVGTYTDCDGYETIEEAQEAWNERNK